MPQSSLFSPPIFLPSLARSSSLCRFYVKPSYIVFCLSISLLYDFDTVLASSSDRCFCGEGIEKFPCPRFSNAGMCTSKLLRRIEKISVTSQHSPFLLLFWQRLQLFLQLRHGVKQICNQPIIRHLKDWRLLVLINSDDDLGVLHASQMLNRT